MALPPDATARDRWLDLADEARAKTQQALAAGDHRTAGMWDEEERRLLGLAYSDAPAPAPAHDDEASAGDFDGDAEALPELASTDGDPTTVGQFLMAANTRKKPASKGRAAPKPLPPEKQAENIRKAREAISNPAVYAFMQAISTVEGDYDQRVGGARFKGTEYPGEASGAYGITHGTRDDVLVPQLGLTDFSRDTQDVMGAHLIVTNRDGALRDIERGDVEKAVEKLRGTWPSLPGGGQTHIDMKEFKARYKKKFDSLIVR